jgi:hypothetical protein
MCKYIKSDIVDVNHKYWRMTISLLSDNQGCGIYLCIDNERSTKGDEIDIVYSNCNACLATVITDCKSKIEKIEAILLDEVYSMLNEENSRCVLQSEYYLSKVEQYDKLLSMKEFRKNKIDSLLCSDTND